MGGALLCRHSFIESDILVSIPSDNKKEKQNLEQKRNGDQKNGFCKLLDFSILPCNLHTISSVTLFFALKLLLFCTKRTRDILGSHILRTRDIPGTCFRIGCTIYRE